MNSPGKSGCTDPESHATGNRKTVKTKLEEKNSKKNKF